MITVFAKESHEDHNREPNKRDIDEDEEEETLSFYEFSINSEADAWEDSSKESSQNSSFKSSEQEEEEDYFEFFSEELKRDTHTTTLSQPENIVFCGKIIPYKQPIVPENLKNTVKEKKRRRRGFFRWRWNFTSSYKSGNSGKIDNDGANYPCTTTNTKNDQLQQESPKQKHSTRKRSQIHGFPVQKMSIFTSMTKSRWYLYLFGITRFRSDMELRDMKSRQTRRTPSITLSGLESSNEDWERKGAWRLLRALSCGGGGDHEANAVAQASVVGRIPGV